MIVVNRTPSYWIAADNITDQYHSDTILGALYASGSNITRTGSTLGAKCLSLLTFTEGFGHWTKRKLIKTIITFILGDLKRIQSINTSYGHNESFRFNHPNSVLLVLTFDKTTNYSPLAKSCRIGFELLPLAYLIYPKKVFYSCFIGYIIDPIN
jgi:hypothetical protein